MAWQNEVGQCQKSSENGAKLSRFFIVDISGTKSQITKRGEISVKGGKSFILKISFFLRSGSPENSFEKPVPTLQFLLGALSFY